MSWSAYPTWLNPGDNAWQMTAATFVGLMSLPGLAVLYGGVMQKRWSVNSMMLTFVAFSLVLVAWCLWAFKMRDALPAMAQATATSTMAINKPPHQNPAQPSYPGARAPAGHPDRADLSEPKGVNGR